MSLGDGFDEDHLLPWHCIYEDSIGHESGLIWAYVLDYDIEDVYALNIRIDNKQYYVSFVMNVTKIFTVTKGGPANSILSLSGCYVPKLDVETIRNKMKTLILLS